VTSSHPNVYGALIADIGGMQEVFPNPELLLTTEDCWHWTQLLQMAIPGISEFSVQFGPNRILDILPFV